MTLSYDDSNTAYHNSGIQYNVEKQPKINLMGQGIIGKYDYYLQCPRHIKSIMGTGEISSLATCSA